MTLARATVSNRASAVRAALLRADTNRDGKLNAAERARATGLVTGAADTAIRESFKQARLRSGFVDVKKARALVNLALSRVLRADTNKNGVSATERSRLTGPIARALSQGATGTTGPKPTGPIGTFGPKAKRLAEAARRQARLMNTRGWCARGVNRAMRAAGLATSPLPSAYMYAKRLAGDSRFREIKGLTKQQLVKLPPGAIAVFEGYAGGRSKHGHIFVSLGNGLEASDHIQRIATHGRFRVFVPRG
jgi:hypothetical protein